MKVIYVYMKYSLPENLNVLFLKRLMGGNEEKSVFKMKKEQRANLCLISKTLTTPLQSSKVQVNIERREAARLT